MEEIQVGEYVRTKDGKIIKFNKFGTLRVGYTNPKYYKTIISNRSHYKYDNIVKHSSNIIDLIEVGDILKLKNGEKWEVQEHQGNGNWLQLEWENIDDNEDFLKKVDSIITKEQFKENSYKVGD